MNEKKWKMENKYEKRLQRAESDSHVHAAYETTFKKKKNTKFLKDKKKKKKL